MSTSIINRYAQEIIKEFLKVNNKEISDEELIKNLDIQYRRLNSEKFWSNQPDSLKIKYNITDIQAATIASNYSFNRIPTIFNLMKIKIPLLITYGTTDIKCADISLLPLFLFDTDVNYTIKAYPNYDHGYSLVGEDGKIINNEFHFDDVFNDILLWFEEK